MKTSRTTVGGSASMGAIIAVAAAMLAWISPVRASVLINTYAGQGTTSNNNGVTGDGNSAHNYYIVPAADSASESNITVTQSTLNADRQRPGSRLVDGSGLETTSAISSPTFTTPPFATPTGMSKSADDADDDNLQMWLADNTPGSDLGHLWLNFALPGIKDLTSMSVWNANRPGTAPRDVKTAYIWYSTDPNPAVVNAGEIGGTAPDGLAVGSAWTMLGSGVFTFGQSDATNSTAPYITPDSISFSGTPTGITHVFIDIETTYGSGGLTTGTGTVSLSEVQFFGDTPEPASFGLLGVGAIALLKRRR